jgi:hypothetical protein
MELESSLVASQNALVVNPPQRDPQQESLARQQEQQRRTTELPRTQVVVRQNAAAFEQAEQFQRDQTINYDQPTNRRARTAINAYNSLEREQRREEIRSLLGVDTFA